MFSVVCYAMPTISDYVTIVGSGDRVKIGDDGVQVWEETFGTGGRTTGQQDAHIIVEFYGLAGGNTAEVLLNDEGQIGSLNGYAGEEHGDQNRHTQLLSFPDERLNNGTNEVQINAVESDTDRYDDFVIENMVCMFHQEA